LLHLLRCRQIAADINNFLQRRHALALSRIQLFDLGQREILDLASEKTRRL
jgi:hypothetical protein